MLDYAKLCEPYTENGRTPEGQRRWLLKKGIPEDAADIALAVIYSGLSEGAEYPDGNELDQALLGAARALVDARTKAALDVGQAQLEAGATRLYRERTNARKPKQMLRNPKATVQWYSGHIWCFVAGVAVGASLCVWVLGGLCL